MKALLIKGLVLMIELLSFRFVKMLVASKNFYLH